MLGAIFSARNTNIFFYNLLSQSIRLYYEKWHSGKAFGLTLKTCKRMSVEKYAGTQGRLEIKVMVSVAIYRKLNKGLRT